MTRPLAVLRPEPGNARTATALRSLGLEAIRLPLFETRAVPWTPPAAERFDALLVTSAAAFQLGGEGLASLSALPVLAVGAATAAAAQAAGFAVHSIGAGDAADLVATAAASGVSHALALAGRDRKVRAGGPVAAVVTVYESVALVPDEAGLARLAGSVALLHSARAAERLALVAPDRASVRVAALSDAVADAAGGGWAACAVAAVPTDAALIAAARRLAD